MLRFLPLAFVAALAACQKPAVSSAPDAAPSASAAGPRLLSVGPRVLSNQTSQPVTVLGERLSTGMRLHLGAPVEADVPLAVLDERHA